MYSISSKLACIAPEDRITIKINGGVSTLVDHAVSFSLEVFFVEFYVVVGAYYSVVFAVFGWLFFCGQKSIRR